MTRKAIALAALALASLAAFASRGNGGAVRGAAARAGMMGGRFTEVEYLRADGNQYINTGYALVSNNAKYELSIDSSVKRADYMIGASMAGGSAAFVIGVPNNWGGDGMWITDGVGALSPQLYKSSAIPFSKNYTALSYNGSSVSFTFANSTSTESRTTSIVSGFPIYLFAVNNGGSVLRDSGYATYPKIIRYAKITDNGILVRDFVPVRDTAGNGYMLDKVTGQLFGNAGTGAFIVGPDK